MREIPIPDDAKINHYDMQVSRYFRDESGRRRRTVIGRAVTETAMHPNDNFRYLHPGLWQEYYGEDASCAYEIHAGMYALALGAGLKSGIYPLLHDIFGPEHANALMDYAMFSIHHRSTSMHLFDDAMADQMLFSRKKLTDDWFCRFLGELDSNLINKFTRAYLQLCAQKGMTEVWLSVDGSNNDCLMQESEYAEKGHAKSGKNVNIVSFIWAVNAGTGQPVAWMVNPGGLHDAKAFESIIRLPALSNMKVKGVILDRGFVSQTVIDVLEELGLEFVVKLKSSNEGYEQMMERHACKIYGRVEHLIYATGRDIMYGITDKVKLFKSGSKEYCVGLFFDPAGHCGRKNRFLSGMIAQFNAIKAQIAADPCANIDIAPKFNDCFSIIAKGKKTTDIVPKPEIIQKIVDAKGYSAIASSEDLSPHQLCQRYAQRDCSEKQFSILKSQLNADVIRAHSDQSMKGRFHAAFIACALRCEIMLACMDLKLDTGQMLRKVNRSRLLLMPNGKYRHIKDHSAKVASLLGYFGVTDSVFAEAAEELNKRASGKPGSQFHTIEGLSSNPYAPPKRGRGRPKGSKSKATLEREAREAREGVPPKRSPGRPKGSKNKATLEREEREAREGTPPKRSPGRPKGSKNKKTLEREELMTEPVIKHPHPGRPKGSKNKATLEREAREAAQLRRGPGRPKGSKNKATLEREEKERQARELEMLQAKRGPGRPKGSKNKATLEREAREAREGTPPKRRPGRPKGSTNKIKGKDHT